MKELKFTVKSDNTNDMNGLVDIICKITNQDSKALRDKFKMIDMASPKKMLDLCEHLNLDITFTHSKPAKKDKNKLSVFLLVNDGFDMASLNGEEKPVKTKTEKTDPITFESVDLNSGDEDEDDNPF